MNKTIIFTGVLLFGIIFFIFISAIYSPSPIYKDKDLKVTPEIVEELKRAFNLEDSLIIFYPFHHRVSVKQGTNNKGFIFAIKNNKEEDAVFKYEIFFDSNYKEIIALKCGNVPLEEIGGYPTLASGEISLPANSSNAKTPELVLFDIPKTAPKCTIPYTVSVESDGELYQESKVYVTIQ